MSEWKGQRGETLVAFSNFPQQPNTELRPKKQTKPTNHIDQHPFVKANWYPSLSRNPPHFCWNMNVHYHVHSSPGTALILSQFNPVHTLPYCFLKVHFNIILPFMPKPFMLSLCFSFSHQNPVCISLCPHPCHTPCPSHTLWTDHSENNNSQIS